MEDKLRIKVKIAEREYPMVIGRQDEEKIRRAAKVINDKIVAYRHEYKIDDQIGYLAMAALQTSIESIDKDMGGTVVMFDELEEVDTLLNEYLAEKK